MTAPKIGPRKVRTTSYKGAILQIKKLFIEPFMQGLELASRNNEFEFALSLFFNTETRSIDVYKAVDQFKMPGVRQTDVATLYIAGEGRRQVYAGHTMLVRLDINTPNLIDIEFEEQVFRLSEGQWNFVKQKLKRMHCAD